MITRRNSQHLTAIFLPIATLVAEIWLINKHPISLDWLGIVMFTIICVLVVFVFFSKKERFFIRELLLSLRGGAGTFAGIIMLLYLLIHIDLLNNSIKDLMDKPDTSGWLPWVYLFFLTLPFLVLGLLANPPVSSVSNDLRKVLVTGISLFGNRGVEPLLSDHEKNALKAIQEAKDKGVENWRNWDPIRQALKLYPNIEEVCLVGSDQTKAFLQGIKDSEFSNLHLLRLLNAEFPKIKVSIQDVEDVQVAEVIYKELDITIMPRLKKSYEDHEMLFAVTGSTAACTAALTLLGVKSNRGVVYTRQDNFKVVELDINLYTAGELIDELIEKQS